MSILKLTTGISKSVCILVEDTDRQRQGQRERRNPIQLLLAAFQSDPHLCHILSKF